MASNWLFSMFFLSLSHKIRLLVFQQGFLCFAVFPISPSPNLRACRSEFGGREPLYSPHYFPIFNPHLTSTLLHLLSGEYTIRNSNKNYYFSLQYKNLIYKFCILYSARIMMRCSEEEEVWVEDWEVMGVYKVFVLQ